jgi:hypothetical protein
MSTLNDAIADTQSMEVAYASQSKENLNILLESLMQSIETRDTSMWEKVITAFTGGGNQHTVHGDVNEALIIEMQKQVAIVKKLISEFK